MNSEQKYFLERESEKTIDKYTKISMGLGAIPIPVLDVAATTTAQVAMIKRLCEINGIEYKDEQSTAIISAIASSFAGKFVASFVKAIPIVGWILGIPAQVAASGILTYATGKAFLGYISANKTITKVRDFDVKDFMGRIKDNVDGGVNYIKETLGKSVPESVIDKLKNLKPEDSLTDISQELEDIAKNRESDEAAEKAQETIDKMGNEIFESPEDFTLWMNRPNKLSEGKTPKQTIEESGHDKVISWLNVLRVMSPENLDIPANDFSKE